MFKFVNDVDSKFYNGWHYFGFVDEFSRPEGLGLFASSENPKSYYIGKSNLGFQSGPLFRRDSDGSFHVISNLIGIDIFASPNKKNNKTNPMLHFFDDHIMFEKYINKRKSIQIRLGYDGWIENSAGRLSNVKHQLNLKLQFPDAINTQNETNRWDFNNNQGFIYSSSEDEAYSGLFAEYQLKNGNPDFYRIGYAEQGDIDGITVLHDLTSDDVIYANYLNDERLYPFIIVTNEYSIKLVTKEADSPYEWLFQFDSLGHLSLQQRLADKRDEIIETWDVSELLKADEEATLGDLVEPPLNVTSHFSPNALEELIGLKSIKTQVERIKAFVIKNQNKKTNLHMCFTGNPGTGKTIVARILADIFYQHKVLPTKNLVETSRSDLVGQFIGHTAPAVKEKIKEALGGILFIDEAYALVPEDSTSDFGPEAIATLLKEMEDKRDEFCLILAGYEKEMNQLIQSNPGFKSRIQFTLNFPDYTQEELRGITKLVLKDKNYELTDDAAERMSLAIETLRGTREFANAREVRKIIDGLIPIQNQRTIHNHEDRTITKEDVELYLTENHFAELIEKALSAQNKTLKMSSKALKVIYKQNPKLLFSEDIGLIKERVFAISLAKTDGKTSESSGFIISPDGLAVTNYHCVEEPGKLEAILTVITKSLHHYQLPCAINVLKTDKRNDLALIQLSHPQIDVFPYFPLDDQHIPTGQRLILAGYLFGHSFNSSISVMEGQAINVSDHKVYTDISGKHGQSGSPVLNKQNNLVTGVFSGSYLNGREEVNYFIPNSLIWSLLES